MAVLWVFAFVLAGIAAARSLGGSLMNHIQGMVYTGKKGRKLIWHKTLSVLAVSGSVYVLLYLMVTVFYISLFRLDLYLGYRLSQDEAGFIALHIVNAEIDGKMSDMVRITELIRRITATVQEYYGVSLDEQSLDYGRFITHLKFLGQRITQNKYSREEDAEFQGMIVRRFRHDYQCAEHIRDDLQQAFGIHLPPEEMTFLTIHLHRLALTMGITEKEE